MQGKASPCVFHHQEGGIRTYVHGDDYVSTAKPDQLQWMKTQLEKKYIVKTQTLGPGPTDQTQIEICNRIVSWHDTKGIIYEVDPRHVEIIFKQLQLTQAKLVTTPGTKDERRTSEDHKEELGDKEATLYRALMARCNYLSPDRHDISYAATEFARAMSKPTRGDMKRIKRMARYLKGKQRLIMQSNGNRCKQLWQHSVTRIGLVAETHANPLLWGR